MIIIIDLICSILCVRWHDYCTRKSHAWLYSIVGYIIIPNYVVWHEVTWTHILKNHTRSTPSPRFHTPGNFSLRDYCPPNLILQCGMANGSIFRFFDLLSCKGWKLVLLLIQFSFTLAILVKLPPKFSCSDYPRQRIEPS